NINIPAQYHHHTMPAFTLQPLIENAVKHGTSRMLEAGVITVEAKTQGKDLLLSVTDNAGLYRPANNTEGLGMNLVHKRIQNLYGESYGITVKSEADTYTCVCVRIPVEEITS
ncbi:ATP-binding protein, partial [Shewanella sp.]